MIKKSIATLLSSVAMGGRTFAGVNADNTAGEPEKKADKRAIKIFVEK